MLRQTAEESSHIFLKTPSMLKPQITKLRKTSLDFWIGVFQNLAPNPMAHLPAAVHSCKILLQPSILLLDHVMVVKIHLAVKDPMESMESVRELRKCWSL